MNVAPRTVAITGASGALGQALLRRWHARGARLLALTHGDRPLQLSGPDGTAIPLQQRRWQVGEEEALRELLAGVDVLVLNHGINVHGDRSREATARSLEVNALSTWRLLELFAELKTAAAEAGPCSDGAGRRLPEVWINTSEAEIQPAISPLYEISKRLIGELVSLRAPALSRQLRIRRLVLGPFRSTLNPVGVMGADFVAGEILRQADLDFGLIIVTPNPLTYVLMPLASLARWLYARVLCGPAPQG
ncbi:MAG: NAD-dependent epimerase/dehydratase family protein [Synechococcaceae cyanobacterium]|nr:NAD-dependent epimerase/dehydratase family protein [Synechococcaceae cyanobacterium]